jgi:hypothetical protein
MYTRPEDCNSTRSSRNATSKSLLGAHSRHQGKWKRRPTYADQKFYKRGGLKLHSKVKKVGIVTKMTGLKIAFPSNQEELEITFQHRRMKRGVGISNAEFNPFQFYTKSI